MNFYSSEETVPADDGLLRISANRELSFLADVDRKIPLGSERKASVANYTTWQHGDLVFPFETTMTGRDASTFAEQYWGELWLSSAAYLAVIYLLRTIMESRPSFSLRVPLIMWNWALALFSMLGVLRMLPELAHVLFTYGTYHSVCVPSYAELNVVCSSWAWLFGMSKLVEYGDTIFIVLRKQPLIFLHWYHHITVMLYTWYSIAEMTASGRWFITLNLFVHSLMYSYYALRAMRVRVSKGVAMSITILQVLQMVVGIWVNISAYMHKAQGSPCSVSYDNIYASFAMYLSYFLLFLNFFYQSYISKTSRKWAQAQAAAAAKAKKVQ